MYPLDISHLQPLQAWVVVSLPLVSFLFLCSNKKEHTKSAWHGDETGLMRVQCRVSDTVHRDVEPIKTIAIDLQGHPQYLKNTTTTGLSLGNGILSSSGNDDGALSPTLRTGPTTYGGTDILVAAVVAIAVLYVVAETHPLDCDSLV